MKEFVKNRYEGTEQEFFWELNRNIKEIVNSRMQYIEQQMEQDQKVKTSRV